MEIIRTYGTPEKSRIYLKDHFDESMKNEFRKLKGRYFKIKNYWVFPKSLITPLSFSENDKTSHIQVRPEQNETQTSSMEQKETQTSSMEQNETQTSSMEYTYKPPIEYYKIVERYTRLLEKMI